MIQGGSILQYFWPSLICHLSIRSLFCLFLSGRFTKGFTEKQEFSCACPIYYLPFWTYIIIFTTFRTTTLLLRNTFFFIVIIKEPWLANTAFCGMSLSYVRFVFRMTWRPIIYVLGWIVNRIRATWVWK